MEALYFNTNLFKTLKTFLPTFADRVTAAGKVMQKHFPSIPWNTRTLWLVCGEEAVRRYICDELNRQEAKKQKLECEWGRREPGPGYIDPKASALWHEVIDRQPEPLSPETTKNRRFVTWNTKTDREAIMVLAWNELADAFLRTAAVTIGDKGRTAVARDAETRLKDFCTIRVETEEQAAFVEAVTKVQDLADALASSFEDLCDTIPDAGEVRRLAAGYDPAKLPLIPTERGSIPLCAPHAVARALVTFFRLGTSVLGDPKFYNRAGFWAYLPADVGAVTGGKVTDTSDARNRVPELYGYTSRTSKVCPALPAED